MLFACCLLLNVKYIYNKLFKLLSAIHGYGRVVRYCFMTSPVYFTFDGQVTTGMVAGNGEGGEGYASAGDSKAYGKTTGSKGIYFDPDSSTLYFDFSFNKLKSGLYTPAVNGGIHIHTTEPSADAATDGDSGSYDYFANGAPLYSLNTTSDIQSGLSLNDGPIADDAKSGTLSGSIVIEEDDVSTLLSGKTYINVHSNKYQNGEIRGNLTPYTTIPDQYADPDMPNPVVTSYYFDGKAGKGLRFNNGSVPNTLSTGASGSGSSSQAKGNMKGKLTNYYNSLTDRMFFNFNFKNLSDGLYTEAANGGVHIHGPTISSDPFGDADPLYFLNTVQSSSVPNQTQDLMLWKGPVADKKTNGTLQGSFAVANDINLQNFNKGLMYTNVHSYDYQGGEIRGNLFPQMMMHSTSGSSGGSMNSSGRYARAMNETSGDDVSSIVDMSNSHC